jgi:hypothetical protein
MSEGKKEGKKEGKEDTKPPFQAFYINDNDLANQTTFSLLLVCHGRDIGLLEAFRKGVLTFVTNTIHCSDIRQWNTRKRTRWNANGDVIPQPRIHCAHFQLTMPYEKYNELLDSHPDWPVVMSDEQLKRVESVLITLWPRVRDVIPIVLSYFPKNEFTCKVLNT